MEVLKLKMEKSKGKKHKISPSSLKEKMGKNIIFPFPLFQKLGRKQHDLCYFPCCEYFGQNQKNREEKNVFKLFSSEGKREGKNTYI